VTALLTGRQGTCETPHSPPVLILSAASDPAAFDRTLSDPQFAQIDSHPVYGEFGRAYYPAIHRNRDCSFAVIADGTPALICLCAPLDETIGFYGRPLRFVARRGLDDNSCGAAVQATFSHLDELAQQRQPCEALVLNEATDLASLIEEGSRARGATMQYRPVAYVDLTAGRAAWRAALRKSFRSLVNWGRRNLSIAYVNEETSDRALFERYREFHAEVSGHITRSHQSWDVMYEWITGGGGELILGFFDGKLITGSMFLDGTEVSAYASGVYDRAQFDKPLAHYPVWLGIERAQARGMKTLQLGPVPPQGTVSEKEYTIGYFKRGFATDIATQLVCKWRPPPPLSGVATGTDQ
jgi:hypothetical protein